ncbi:MAG: HEPN domain-containing protein [Pseudomonadota bacterium]
MSHTNDVLEIAKYWMEKSREALDSARSEFAAGRFAFAMNRSYYACFYSASAVLLKLGHKFSKHSGVRAAIHQQLVKAGILSSEFGKLYDRLFENRQEGDYLELVNFEAEQISQAIEEAASFVEEMQKLLY